MAKSLLSKNADCKFIFLSRFEMLRKEYLNQTFNFMPNVQEEYDKVTRSLFYDKAQVLITEKKDYDREGLSK